MLMEAQLKAYIITGNVTAGDRRHEGPRAAGRRGGASPALLKLGRLLEKELENTRARKNTKALAELSSAYKTFLTTLAEAKTGQTYESLDWAGRAC